MVYTKAVEKTAHYDVLVVGGGPAGVCAAASAAREKAKTLLVERFGMLGGMMTSGHVSPILGSVGAGTMSDEIVALLAKAHPGSVAPVTRNGREAQVDVEEAKTVLQNFVHESGAEIFFQTTVIDVLKQGNKVCGVILTTPTGLMAVEADCVIDATGDGYVAMIAGAKYEVGRDGDGYCQPTTLEFVIDGVDETQAITCFGGSDPVCLPDGTKYSEFCKQANQRGELPENVTIVRLHRTHYSGERSVNATQSNRHDTLSLQGISDALLDLRNQIDQVTAFLRKNIPGYENCRVKSSADVLGLRETRRVLGSYVMSDADVENGNHFEDVVVHNAWFLIDIHNPTGGGQAEKHSKMAKAYDIPYGCFVPNGVENLLVTGRCISGTHRAHASYRVMAICMAMGEAVGIAAALCSKSGTTPRLLPVKEIQKVLQDRGIQLFDD
ncbi:FAD-dependent oxidoreductase [uncultured Dysosmobacter sp.]|uniref:FAD-dependent oxidoreductase n=1 Tax=uncultured Dysosmobacter sp. TaxID=2591384 RepID=UPI00261645A0|nr:FAD-dependent oxidoreductase [uncultured Dysosmobacter sp.]